MVLAKLGLNLPMALARGRVPLPQDWLDVSNESAGPQWRSVIRKLDKQARLHFEHISSAYACTDRRRESSALPVALVEPYLRALTRSGHDPARDLAAIAPLTRTWRLAKTHMRGRL